MSPPKRNLLGSEFKVGLFVLAALLVLAYMSLKVGQFSLGVWGEGVKILASFQSASGLAQNGRVEIAGVEVGRIKEIRLRGEQAQVEMTIQPAINLRQDAQALVRSKGMLGEKYIELLPGSAAAPSLPPGGLISDTKSAVEFDQVLSKVPRLVDDLRPILEDVRNISQSLRNVIGTAEGESSLKEMLANFNKASKSLSHLAQGLEKGEGTLGKLLKDDQLYRELRLTVQDIQGSVRHLNTFSERLSRGEGTLGKLAKDDSLYQQAQQALTRLNSIAQKIDKAEGTLGKLVNDKSLYTDAQKAIKNVNQAMEGVKEQTPITVLGTIGSTVLK
jgi:phospholipid/cholesterol/gamma-HCH transport system substrate-binding protein